MLSPLHVNVQGLLPDGTGRLDTRVIALQGLWPLSDVTASVPGGKRHPHVPFSPAPDESKRRRQAEEEVAVLAAIQAFYLTGIFGD